MREITHKRQREVCKDQLRQTQLNNGRVVYRSSQVVHYTGRPIIELSLHK